MVITADQAARDICKAIRKRKTGYLHSGKMEIGDVDCPEHPSLHFQKNGILMQLVSLEDLHLEENFGHLPKQFHIC